MDSYSLDDFLRFAAAFSSTKHLALSSFVLLVYDHLTCLDQEVRLTLPYLRIGSASDGQADRVLLEGRMVTNASSVLPRVYPTLESHVGTAY